MANQKKNKSIPGEERFVATGKSVTLLKPAPGKSVPKKKTGTARGGR